MHEFARRVEYVRMLVRSVVLLQSQNEQHPEIPPTRWNRHAASLNELLDRVVEEMVYEACWVHGYAIRMHRINMLSDREFDAVREPWVALHALLQARTCSQADMATLLVNVADSVAERHLGRGDQGRECFVTGELCDGETVTYAGSHHVSASW